MARDVQVFVCMPVEACEAAVSAIHSLFASEPFTVVTACTNPTFALTQALFDYFHPSVLLSDLWNPQFSAYHCPPDLITAFQQRISAQILLHRSSPHVDFVRHQHYLMTALHSLTGHNTVICAFPEEVKTILHLNNLQIKSEPYFLVIERINSLRRRVLFDLSTYDEVLQWVQMGGFRPNNAFLLDLTRKITENLQQTFIKTLPVSIFSKFSDVVEGVQMKFTQIAQEIETAFANLKEKRQKLAARAVEINTEADRIAGKIEEFAENQEKIRLELVEKLKNSGIDLNSAINRVQLLEKSPSFRQLSQIPVEPKRKPFKIVSVFSYPTKIYAKIQCFRHYQGNVYLGIVSQGQYIKEDVKLINPGEGEIEVCMRGALGEGEYWLQLSSYPDRSKELCVPVPFNVTAFQPGSHLQSFFYLHHPDPTSLEASLHQVGGQDLVSQFQTLTVTCTDTDVNRMPAFYETALQTPDPTALKTNLEAQGFTFL